MARAVCVSLRDQLKKVSAERDRLRTDCERRRAELEVARRAEKRQAAPNSKGAKKLGLARQGRKPGETYGNKPGPLTAACARRCRRDDRRRPTRCVGRHVAGRLSSTRPCPSTKTS